MPKEYFVLDGEDNTVWHGREKNDKPQRFASFKAAEQRARAFAKTGPGEAIKIVEVVATVSCPVGAPNTKRS